MPNSSFNPGDLVVYVPDKVIQDKTVTDAQQLIQGELYRVADISNDGIYVRVEGVEPRFALINTCFTLAPADTQWTGSDLLVFANGKWSIKRWTYDGKWEDI